MSVRETAIAALEAALVAGGVPNVQRGGTEPERVPAEGMVIIRDGDPGEPEVSMSPLTYHYQHRAVLEVLVQHASEATRAALLDGLLEAVASVIAADRTLGGAVDWAQADAPAPVEEPIVGAAGIKAAEVGVILHYATADPLT